MQLRREETICHTVETLTKILSVTLKSETSSAGESGRVKATDKDMSRPVAISRPI